MIPKKIHYCWFGSNPLPALAQKCIASWKKYCPDYEIIEWNEDNFDISLTPVYVRQAFDLKRWAFVTDYVRLQVVYEHGGIYLDTDVELKKSLDSLCKYHAYFGFEDGRYIATGLGFGAEMGASILNELMEDYIDIEFILADGQLDLTPCPQRNTSVFVRNGLMQDNSWQILGDNILILPSIYLCPIDYQTMQMRRSNKTISIHWFAASWQSEQQRKQMIEGQRRKRRWELKNNILHIPTRLARLILGDKLYEKIRSKLKNKC